MSKMDDMDGGNSEDRVLVAEYVLGLLDPEEHAAVARRLGHLGEIFQHQPDALDRHAIRQRMVARRAIGLEAVRQRVKTGACPDH